MHRNWRATKSCLYMSLFLSCIRELSVMRTGKDTHRKVSDSCLDASRTVILQFFCAEMHNAYWYFIQRSIRHTFRPAVFWWQIICVDAVPRWRGTQTPFMKVTMTWSQHTVSYRDSRSRSAHLLLKASLDNPTVEKLQLEENVTVRLVGVAASVWTIHLRCWGFVQC